MDHLQQKKEEEEQRWKEEVEEKKIRLAKNALIFLSVLVVATVPVAWCSTGQPALLVWRLSLLLCCSSFFCSRLLDVTVSAVTMFLAIFSGFMAALYVDAMVDRDSGGSHGPSQLPPSRWLAGIRSHHALPAQRPGSDPHYRKSAQ
jgi:hypothetical protein